MYIMFFLRLMRFINLENHRYLLLQKLYTKDKYCYLQETRKQCFLYSRCASNVKHFFEIHCDVTYWRNKQH